MVDFLRIDAFKLEKRVAPRLLHAVHGNVSVADQQIRGFLRDVEVGREPGRRLAELGADRAFLVLRLLVLDRDVLADQLRAEPDVLRLLAEREFRLLLGDPDDQLMLLFVDFD